MTNVVISRDIEDMCQTSIVENRLGVFAKHWTPGQVKTRLAAIGIENASQVYLQILKHLLSKLKNVRGLKAIVYSPAERRIEFSELAQGDWSLVAQCCGGLGDRLIAFFADQFQQGLGNAKLDCRTKSSEFVIEPAALPLGLKYPNVVVIGSDCPAIDRQLIDEAFRKLEEYPVVIGPSRDGGYYLIGLNQPHWELFQRIDWSTDRVFSQTTDILRRLGVEFEVMKELTDIDTPQDLVELIQDLSDSVELNDFDQLLLKELKSLTARK